MNDLKESIEESIETSDLIEKIETLQQENKDLQKQIDKFYFVIRFFVVYQSLKKMILGRGISESGWSTGSQIELGSL